MVTWASVTAQPAPEAAPQVDSTLLGKRVAVVDANAIIAMGTALKSLGQVLVTTDEVLEEVRDPVARRAMEQVEFMSHAPGDSALKAVAAFARKTGDMHQLSSEDVRLLAVAYGLETELNGTAHLRTEPVPVTMHTKATPTGAMPGWGNNGQSDEWAAIDALEDDDVSTVRRSESQATSTQREVPQPSASQSLEAMTAGDEWEVARASRNASRRAKRKAQQRETDQAGADGAAVDDTADAVAQLRIVDASPNEVHKEREASSQPHADSEVCATAASFEEHAPQSQGLTHGAATAHTHNDDEGSQDGSAAEQGADEEPDARQADVLLVTSDFAMQNVALQMGLRLESRGGKRITSLQRVVQRCDGCRTVIKSTSKLFCPACGHATLSSVTVTIGPDGAEQYGVRKKHVLRGTRYSLPKPKSGRNAANPILSEDVYRQKVRKPRKKVVDADEDALGGLNLGELKKHANQPSHIAQGLSHLHTSCRNNPNERRDVVRSSRRR